LVPKLGVTAGIAAMSLSFALAHGHPYAAIAVLPMGIWLGVVAWLSGSVTLTIVCHLLNNVVALATAALTAPSPRPPGPWSGPLAKPDSGPIWGVAIIGLMIACVASLVLWPYRKAAIISGKAESASVPSNESTGSP
jgi:membrane protease YdiL (CAAX protease family)